MPGGLVLVHEKPMEDLLASKISTYFLLCSLFEVSSSMQEVLEPMEMRSEVQGLRVEDL